jgi:hypothetical protein
MSPNYATNALWDALVQWHDKRDKPYLRYTRSTRPPAAPSARTRPDIQTPA